MDDQKLEIIKQLMEELVGSMQPSHDDFDSRLGKPKIEMMKIGAESPEMEGDEDKMGMDDDDDHMGQDPMDMVMDPEEKLKARIMKLKG